eukprot:gnl/Dysnectes_brevis/1399_a1576_3492.p1 GENE.gnl/Dysnectes_brevis/1399_a1576_3492~~gnl/Dysnectes_brevis/1399_a1576_3492.p1  ORF type:complete len:1118 (+),score=443.07 gnl/Dysnectes_brevis/1399_a1576_3492:37-3390(+)
MEFDQFCALLMACQTAADPETRAQVETTYFGLREEHPDAYVSHMLQIIGTNHPVSTFASVLFRRDLEHASNSSLVRTQNADLLLQTKTTLLQALSTGTNVAVLRQIANATGQLALYLFREGAFEQWPELFTFITSHQEGTPILRRATMIIMSFIVNLPFKHVANLNEDNRIMNILQSGYQAQENKVAVAAIRASCNLIVNCGNDDGETPSLPVESGSQILQAVVTRINDMITSGLSGAQKDGLMVAEDAFKELTSVADESPVLFRPFLPQFVQLLKNVLTTPAAGSGLQRLSMSVLTHLCEGIQRAVKTQCSDDICSILSEAIIPFMGRLEDERLQEWMECLDPDTWQGDEIAEQAEETLDRISIALGGSVILPVIRQFVGSNSSEQDWRVRYACATALSIVAEGISNTVSNADISSIISAVVSFASDGHPRVRWASINAVGQICDDFAPRPQQMHAQVMPMLLQLAADDVARVSSHSLAAGINFLEDADLDHIFPYIDPLMNAIGHHWEKDYILSNQNAITCLATLASKIGGDVFKDYYDRFMPTIFSRLHDMLNFTGSPDALRIKYTAKLIEATSIIGATCPSKFMPQYGNVMDAILQVYRVKSEEEEDTLSKYALYAIARMARISVTAFASFLDQIVPVLQDVLGQEYIEMKQVMNMEDEGYKLSINPHVLVQKGIALHAMTLIMQSEKESFLGFLRPVVDIIIEKQLLSNSLNDNVRQYSFECLCSAPEIAFSSGNHDTAIEVLKFIWKPLLKALVTEADLQVQNFMLESLVFLLETISQLNLGEYTHPILAELSIALNETSKGALNQLITLQTNMEEEEGEIDEEDQTYLRVQNELTLDVTSNVAECYGELIKRYKDNIIPVFNEHIRPLVEQWGSATGMLSDHFITHAVCILDDLLDHVTPSVSWPIMSDFIPSLVGWTNMERPGLSHVCFYGCGLAMERYGAQGLMTQFIPTLLTNARAAINPVMSGTHTSVEHMRACDNAVTLLSRTAESVPADQIGVDIDELWVYWIISARLVRSDDAEVTTCLKTLVGHLLNNHTVFLQHLDSCVGSFLNLLCGPYMTIHKEDPKIMASAINVLSMLLADQGQLVDQELAKSSELVQSNFSQLREML